EDEAEEDAGGSDDDGRPSIGGEPGNPDGDEGQGVEGRVPPHTCSHERCRVEEERVRHTHFANQAGRLPDEQLLPRRRNGGLAHVDIPLSDSGVTFPLSLRARVTFFYSSPQRRATRARMRCQDPPARVINGRRWSWRTRTPRPTRCAALWTMRPPTTPASLSRG